MRKICVLVIFSVLLAVFCSCKSFKQGPKVKSNPESTYIPFIESLKNLEIEQIDTVSIGSEEKFLLEVINDILNSNFQIVENKIKKRLAAENLNPYRNELLRFLSFSLFFQSKWSELLPTNNYYFFDPDSVFLLAKVFSKIDSQQIYFIKDIDTIYFTTAPNGAIIVQVEVNGKKRNFWFDTGTNYSIVSSKTAEDCNLPFLTSVKSKALTHTDYKVDVTPTYFPTLQIGNIVIVNHPCLVVEDFNLKLQLIASNVPTEIYGIIGWKSIQNAKFTIDYNKRQIIIERPKFLSTKDKNFFWFGVPIIIGKFHNRNILFVFDLGSERSYLTNKIFNKVSFQKVYEQTKKVGSVGGWKFNPSIVVPYFEVLLDTMLVKFTDIQTVTFPKDYFFNIDGILGLDFVKQAKISFDILNCKFNITKSEAE